VSRAVGGAVVRNKVKRRLRHLVRDRLHLLPGGSLLVVRANPPAASARYERLAAELDVALDRLLKRSGSGGRVPKENPA
jgi:ribonuclease P protein component